MKGIKLLSIVMMIIGVYACSKDDGGNVPKTEPEPIPENQAPTFDENGYTFEVLEDSGTIGNVSATDPEKDDISFSISGSGGDLFSITANGELVIKEGSTLDFETSSEHSITLVVSDGDKSSETNVVITVADVPEPYPNDKNAFVTTWKIENPNEPLQIGLNSDFEYDFTINWGDDNIEQAIGSTNSITHLYSEAGDYQVAIIGTFPAIKMSEADVSSQISLISIDQWGTGEWKSFNNSFLACVNMTLEAMDIPDPSDVEEMIGMFAYCLNFVGNDSMKDWDVSNVTNMGSMFAGNIVFNADISDWNVENVQNMTQMFTGAQNFNRSLGGWNIGNVTVMEEMFDGSGMSTANFDATIMGWYDSGDFQENVTLGADGVYYCLSEQEVSSLEEDYGWTIKAYLDPDCL